MAFTSKRRPFGSSVGRTFGSPFSGYRGDYTVYPDEPWKISLRKYPYPGRDDSPGRRARSVSPTKRRNVAARAALSRRTLEDIISKIDTTQGDLHALAQKVAAWSREAASLSAGLKDEALLLELGRQADRLAAKEAQHRAMQKQERVYRLSMENSELRRELRDLIRIVKMLLDRRSPPRRHAWEDEAEAEGRSPLPPPATAAANLPYYSASYAAAPPPPRGSRRAYSYGGSYEVDIEGLTDESAPYFVAAARAEADADADLSRLAEARARGTTGAAGGGGGGAWYDREVAAQAAMFEKEMARDRQQVGSALTAVDQALHELTISFQGRNGSGSGGGRAPPPAVVSEAWAAAEPRSAAPSFGGFVQPQEVQAVEATPAVPEAWRRRQQQEQRRAEEEQQQQHGKERQEEVERVRMQLAVAERELAEAVAEEAEAAAATDAAEAGVVAAAAEVAKGGSSGGGVREEAKPVVGTPLMTPVKEATGGGPVPAPPTPIYHGVPYSSGGGAGGSSGAPSTVPRGAAHAASPYNSSYSRDGGGAAPLDTVLMTEVENLRRINKALASTLLSYNRVANRLDDAASEITAPAAAAVSAAGTGAARALFPSTSRPASGGGAAVIGGGISLAAVTAPSAMIDFQPAASVATTYGGDSSAPSAPSVHSTVHSGRYTPSYPLGVSARAAAAPLTPPPAVRHLRPEEPRVVTWAPSVSTPPARERSYGDGAAAAAVAGEARRLDSSLDYQLYGIRQQLQALRHDMVTDRLVALAASSPGGAAAAAALAAAPPPPATPDRDAAKLARLEEEVSELRQQVQHDRRWYHDSLDSVVSERTVAFRDLQRRIDRLMTSAI